MDYISRGAAIRVVEFYKSDPDGVCHAVESLKRITAEAVRPVKRGKWEKRHVHRGGIHRYTGIDDMGEKHTITVDERVEYDDLYCSCCGAVAPDNFLNFCSRCGADMTGEGQKETSESPFDNQKR